MAEEGSTIIIKKIKKGGHGHHGGAWKVAYADFVTAMMAFFLLMWLLAVSSEEQLEGIAKYFTPTIGLAGGMGVTLEGGTSNDPNFETQSIIFGAPSTGSLIKTPDNLDESDTEWEEKSFIEIEQSVHKMVKDHPDLRKYSDSIALDSTPEGLRIQLIHRKDRPLFEPGSDALLPHAKILLEKISSIIRFIPNYLSIAGHTSGTGEDEDNWALSAARANSARSYMVSDGGIDKEHVFRVEGKADRDPYDKEEPDEDSNIRIAITLLKHSIIAYRQTYGKEAVSLNRDGSPSVNNPAHKKGRKVISGKLNKKSQAQKGEAANTQHPPTTEHEQTPTPSQTTSTENSDSPTH